MSRSSLHHQFEHLTPDLFNSTAGGEGFVTRENSSSLRGLLSFWSVARPFSLFTAYFIVAWIFAYMWSSARHAREYYYMALHLLACALIQARLIDSLDLTIDTGRHYALGFVLETYHAGFGLFLGLAFARTRRSVFNYGMPILLVAPCLVLAFLPDAFSYQAAFNFTRKWITGSAYLGAAAACLLQAWHLHTATRHGGAYLPVRVRRLAMFGLALAAVGATYVVFAHSFEVTPSITRSSLWVGSQDLLLVLFLAFLSAREYRQRALLVHRTPVSEYHSGAALPEEVSGILLVVDLKSSEAFYRHRAGTGDARDLVSLWRWHLYSCASHFGGLTIHKKGDEIAVLFDSKKSDDSLLDALSAAEKMEEISLRVAGEFSSQGMMPEGTSGFRFRAAVCEAVLRPAWEQLGTGMEPSWEEARGSKPFETVERLFKFEKRIQGSSSKTLFALPWGLLSRSIELKPGLKDRIVSDSGEAAA